MVVVKLSHWWVNPLLWAFYPNDTQPEQLDSILGPSLSQQEYFQEA